MALTTKILLSVRCVVMNRAINRLKDLIKTILYQIKIKLTNMKIYNQDVSIICNNCTGADILHLGGLKFNTPTVNLFIPAEDYNKFISNLPYYLGLDVVECKEFSDHQREKIFFHLNEQPECAGFPFGLVGDVLVCFMHYNAFNEAREAWNRRKTRVNFNHLGILYVQYKEDMRYLFEFDKMILPYSCKKTIMTMNKSIDGLQQSDNVVVPDLPKDVHWMKERSFLKKYYQKEFDIVKYINSL